jgi:hypothetical protein
MHCGRLTHEGVAITDGTRYLLVGFVRVSCADAPAYARYLAGMGRLTHARRLKRLPPWSFRACGPKKNMRSSLQESVRWRGCCVEFFFHVSPRSTHLGTSLQASSCDIVDQPWP